jgi:drug/metabolite transporter (DMT)-like permease
MTAPPRGAVLRMSAGAALISTTSIFVRWAHVSPTLSAFYRMAFGAAMLLVLLFVRRQSRSFAPRDYLWMLLPAFAFAADLTIWHRSIQYIGPGLATLAANFQVFILALVGVVFFHERITWRFIAGVALALFGLWLLVGTGWSSFTPQFRLGVYFGLFTGVCYAVYLLSLRRATAVQSTLTPVRALFLNSLLSAAILGAEVFVEGGGYAIPDAQTWTALLGLAFFGQVLGWVLIAGAMPQLPASLVGLLLLLQPALSFVLDVLLFQRPTSGLDWLGLALSLVGIFIGSVRGKPAPVGEPA